MPPTTWGWELSTQAWLAVSDEPGAQVSGRFLFHKREVEAHPAMHDRAFQEGLLGACAGLSGVELFPARS